MFGRGSKPVLGLFFVSPWRESPFCCLFCVSPGGKAHSVARPAFPPGGKSYSVARSTFLPGEKALIRSTQSHFHPLAGVFFVNLPSKSPIHPQKEAYEDSHRARRSHRRGTNTELPIGTAAPTERERQEAEHFFVGNKQITDYYSASMFETDVINLLDRLFLRHDTALLSGGSMMYIDAVCNGIDDLPTIDNETRLAVKRKLETQGLPALVEELRRLDPEHYRIVDQRNPRRVCHAVEICRMTGTTYSSFRKKEVKQRPFRILKIGLNRPREELYARINTRVLEMMETGLEAEARSVYPQRGMNSLNTVGYKELFAHFDGQISKEEAVRQIQSHTREYMRKQLTWFKRDAQIKWFHPDNPVEILNYIETSIAVTD